MAVDFLTAQRHSSPQFRCDEREDVLIRLHPARNANIVRIPLERGRVAHSIYGSRARTRATGKGVLLYVTAAHKVRHPGSLAGGHVCRLCVVPVASASRVSYVDMVLPFYSTCIRATQRDDDTPVWAQPGAGPERTRFPFRAAGPRSQERAPAMAPARPRSTLHRRRVQRTPGSAAARPAAHHIKF